ncbi:MAG: hypothetical protein E6G57_01025 [Actinobacteria bacterium]|nr:MAG: hypothetical protein E6G57_01025 [Actinomycetota bacterium]
MNRAVACAALAAILLAACGGGGGAKKTAAKGGTTTSSEETTSTAAGSSTTAAGAAGATATTKAAAKPGTAGGPTVNGKPANNYTPPAGATPAKPTAPGTYHYDTSGSSTVGAQSSAPPSVTPLVVDPPAGTRQHSARDERDSSGNGSLTETTLDFQPQGVYLVEIKVTTKAGTLGSQTLDFVANPPALAAPTGVKPGQSVEFDLSGSGTNIHVHIDFVRMETLTIGGQAVDTMFIHQVGTLSGQINGTQTSDSWVAPQYDLFVKDHTVADLTAYGSIKAHSDITSQLQKLTPG